MYRKWNCGRLSVVMVVVVSWWGWWGWVVVTPNDMG